MRLREIIIPSRFGHGFPQHKIDARQIAAGYAARQHAVDPRVDVIGPRAIGRRACVAGLLRSGCDARQQQREIVEVAA